MSTQVIDGLVVETEGSGPALLLVHGLGGTSNTFAPQMEMLAEHFSVIRPDLPNAGRTGVMPPATLREIAERLARLLDALNVSQVALVGHSMGTVLCQYLAETAPARVSRMALLGPIQEPAEAGRKALRDRAGVARSQGMADIADTVVKIGLAAETRATQSSTVAFVRESLMRQPAEGYARLCEALAEAGKAEPARLACPTLLVTGDQDATSPVAAVEAMSQALSDARLVVLPACGHWASVEHPYAINVLLENFLRS